MSWNLPASARSTGPIGTAPEIGPLRVLAWSRMRLVERAELAYPIILAPDGRVLDGMHRVAKALLQG